MNERTRRGSGEAAGDDAYREFREGADLPPVVSRRNLLRLLGASAALAGAAGCSRGPQEYIVPYVNQPPEVTPSVPSSYATTMMMGGYGIGLVMESHEGRPTKAEGNPRHPASAGGLGTIEQACTLTLYDPTRTKTPLRHGQPAPWDDLELALAAPLAAGKELHVLLEPTSSPHVVDLVGRLRQASHPPSGRPPGSPMVFHFDSPLSRSSAYAGSKLAFGQVVELRPDFSKAAVVLSLDDDFLSAVARPMAWARAWAVRRAPGGQRDEMSRVYIVEGRLTVTGMSADERLRAQARQVQGIAADLLAQLLLAMGERGASDVAQASAAARAPGPYAAWVTAVARDLAAHPGASLVVVGDHQPAEVHALAHAMNDLLGNVGSTLTYGACPIFEAGGDSHGLRRLVQAIARGVVGRLLMVGGDPVYTAPADVDLARHVDAVADSIFVGSHVNHTAQRCAWSAPELHFLECWGDALAFDGTPSLSQPLISPLVDGQSAGQVLASMLGGRRASSRTLVRELWRHRHGEGDFETFWRQALVHGVVGTGPAPPIDTAVDWGAMARLLTIPGTPPGAVEILYYADAKVLDGRFANNPWLQELSDPVTKLTWDNAALMSPATAGRHGVGDGDSVAITVRGRSICAPVLAVPAMADDLVALAIGYGQEVENLLGYHVGVDAYRLRDSHALRFDNASIAKAGPSAPLALTQEHWTMEGRPIALRRTLREYRLDPAFTAAQNTVSLQLYNNAPDAEHQWGMTIDLNRCTGCSACVVACYAENNIPVVGKDGVLVGRQMDWIRLDRYFVGDPGGAAAVTQPMLCQHCEQAPCEYVCPVNATVHSHDGLNEMVYNRCVGTRWCSNNCPYKVRRFNFFAYNRGKDSSHALATNPDVTVRQRGVMEKCSYCVQRIREVEIRAHRERRPMRDFALQTACQQTCPTGAIVFGDIADPSSRVARTYADRRVYQVLHELGTRPRTRYLARIVNPNPALHGP